MSIGLLSNGSPFFNKKKSSSNNQNSSLTKSTVGTGRPMTAASPPPLPHGLQLSPISSPLRPRTSPSTILDPEASATFFPERTYHLAILEEMFFKARRMYEEHQLAPPIQLLTRTSSDKAARVYYAMYTLLQASISASQADKLEHYIRTKAPQLSPLLFNLKEWESSLSIARLVRTHELKDARMQLMGQRQQLAAQLLDASATLRAMGKDVTNLKATALRDAAELRQLMKNTQEAVMGAVGAFVARQDEALRAKDAAARQAADNLADEQQRGAQVDAARAALAVELAAAKEAVTVLRKRVKALEVREKELLRRTEAAEDAAQAAVKKSNKAVREAAADLAEAEEKLAAAAAETDALREEVRKAGDTSARLAVSQSTVSELETTVAALRDAAQEQTAEVGNLRKSMDLTQRAFQEEAARAADAAEARERALAEEIEAGLGRRLADAQAAWAASQQPVLDALEKESADQRARGALLEAQLADERTRAVGLEAAAQALKAELDEWKARAAAAVDGAVQPAAAASDAPDARVEGLQAAMRRQATDHAAAMAERGGEVAALKAELEEWKARAAAATAATVAAPEAAPAPQPATAAPVEQPVEPSPQPAAALALTEAAASGPVFAEPVAPAAEAHVAPPVEPLAEVDTPVDAPAEIDAEVDPAPLAPSDAADNGHDEMSLSDCSEAALSEREVLDRDSAVVATGSAVDPAEGPAVDADADADVGANAPDAVEEGVEADTQPAAVSVLAAAKAAAEAVAIGEEQAAAPAENSEKASKDKPKLRRRDSMMAMQGDEGGEGGDEDDEDAPVLTDLEDRFLTAVAYNKDADVKDCLKKDPTIANVHNSFGRDAMQIAARNGNIDMMELLVKHGANVATMGKKGDSLYHLAAYNGKVKVIRWLLKTNKELARAVDSDGRTAMHVAAQRGEFEIITLLQERVGFDMRVADTAGQTVLQCIPRVGEDRDLMDQCREFVRGVCADLDRADRSREEMRARLQKK